MPAPSTKPCPKCSKACAVMVEGINGYNYQLECFECKLIAYGREAELETD